MTVVQFPKPQNDNPSKKDTAIVAALLIIIALGAVIYALRWPLIALFAIYAAIKVFSS